MTSNKWTNFGNSNNIKSIPQPLLTYWEKQTLASFFSFLPLYMNHFTYTCLRINLSSKHLNKEKTRYFSHWSLCYEHLKRTILFYKRGQFSSNQLCAYRHLCWMHCLLPFVWRKMYLLWIQSAFFSYAFMLFIKYVNSFEQQSVFRR